MNKAVLACVTERVDESATATCTSEVYKTHFLPASQGVKDASPEAGKRTLAAIYSSYCAPVPQIIEASPVFRTRQRAMSAVCVLPGVCPFLLPATFRGVGALVAHPDIHLNLSSAML